MVSVEKSVILSILFLLFGGTFRVFLLRHRITAIVLSVCFFIITRANMFWPFYLTDHYCLIRSAILTLFYQVATTIVMDNQNHCLIETHKRRLSPSNNGFDCPRFGLQIAMVIGKIESKFNFYIYFLSFCTNDARFPIDWKTPTGYLLVVILEYLLIIYPVFFATALICFGIGSFFNALMLVDRISSMIQEFGGKAANQTQCDFANYVRFHSSVNQLVYFYQFKLIIFSLNIDSIFRSFKSRFKLSYM